MDAPLQRCVKSDAFHLWKCETRRKSVVNSGAHCAPNLFAICGGFAAVCAARKLTNGKALDSHFRGDDEFEFLTVCYNNN